MSPELRPLMTSVPPNWFSGVDGQLWCHATGDRTVGYLFASTHVTHGWLTPATAADAGLYCTLRRADGGRTVIIIRQHLTALDGREYAAFEVLGSGIYANENEVLRTASAMSDMPHRGVDHSPWSR